MYDIDAKTTEILDEKIPLSFWWRYAFSISDQYAAWFTIDDGNEIAIMDLFTRNVTYYQPASDVYAIYLYKDMLIKNDQDTISVYNISNSKVTQLVESREGKSLSLIRFQINSKFLLYEEFSFPSPNMDWERELKILDLNSEIIYNLGLVNIGLLHGDEVLMSSYNHTRDTMKVNHYNLIKMSLVGITPEYFKIFPIAIQDNYFLWMLEDKSIVYYNRISGVVDYEFGKNKTIKYRSAYNDYFVYTEKSSSKESTDVFLFNLSSKETIRLTDTKNVKEYRPIVYGNYIIWGSYEDQETLTPAIPGISLIATIVTLTAVSWTFRFIWKRQNSGRP